MEDNTNGLTLRDLVLEVRQDVKELRTSTEARLSKLEGSGLRLQGAWTSLGVLASMVAGSAGLAVGIINVLN